MSNLKNWAENELNIAGIENKEVFIKIIETFSNQGHSGFSASYALSFINNAIDKGYDVVENELDSILAKSDDEYGMQSCMTNGIKEILVLFKEYNLSKDDTKKITRLLNWKPITPLTGEEEEWSSILDISDNSQQNKKCSAVFRKNKDNSTAYYIDGKIFSDDGGKTWFTSKDSFVPVTFPYIIPDKPERVIL